MAVPKILVIPGSLRAKSYNVRLAALASKELTLADADVTRISLVDYPLPIYDADTAEKSGPPRNAFKLKQLMSAHQGVFIASPEYNASLTPRGSGRFRRTLAGAMITLSGAILTVERAPSRRTGAKARKSGPKRPFTKAR